MYQYPCKACPDRVLGCHSTCQKYKDAKVVHKQKFDEINRQKARIDDINDYQFKTKEKNKNRARR